MALPEHAASSRDPRVNMCGPASDVGKSQAATSAEGSHVSTISQGLRTMAMSPSSLTFIHGKTSHVRPSLNTNHGVSKHTNKGK